MLLLDPAMKMASYFLGCSTAASFQILNNLSRVTLPLSATPFLAAPLKYKLVPRFRVRTKVTYEGRISLRLYACIMMQYNTHHTPHKQVQFPAKNVHYVCFRLTSLSRSSLHSECNFSALIASFCQNITLVVASSTAFLRSVCTNGH
jgi:hypothetical protein